MVQEFLLHGTSAPMRLFNRHHARKPDSIAARAVSPHRSGAQCDGQHDRQGEAPVPRRSPLVSAGEGEPEMGANVFSRLRTQRDVARIFVQGKGSPFDSIRR